MNMPVRDEEFNGASRKRAISTAQQPDDVTRRSLLGAIPAFGFGALVAAGASPVKAAGADTPVAVLFREWKACHEWTNAATWGPDGDDDAEYDRRCGLRTEIEARLFAEPAVNANDIVLKLLALTLDGQDFMDDCNESGRKIVHEARALVGEVRA